MALYINICRFIWDFCSIVNFLYVSPFVFVLHQKDVVMSDACVSKFCNFQSFEAFQHHRIMDKLNCTLKNSKWWCCHLVFEKMVVFATLSTLGCQFARSAYAGYSRR